MQLTKTDEVGEIPVADTGAQPQESGACSRWGTD